jgi:hypothetical protein
MSEKDSALHPALKHGGYSGTSLLPGEDPGAFEELHAGLIAEHGPAGPLEEDIVTTMAHLIWRKQNISTYQRAERAKRRLSAIRSELVPQPKDEFAFLSISGDMPDPEEVRAAEHAAEEQARKELGKSVWELVEMGSDVTIDRLLSELSLVDRLDGMIDRCIKRLLLVRGLKSISSSESKASSPPKRITAA